MKTALVTGASGAIGKEIVKKYVQNGFFVIAQYNNSEEEINKLLEEVEDDGYHDCVYPFKADFTKTKDVISLFDYTVENFNKIDVLINNAGVDLYKLMTETTESDFDKVFDINVKAIYTLTSLCLKKMIERKYGKIVFVSSIWGKVGGSMETLYSASKASLIGLTKALAKEVSPSNINVNCICPGVIESPMNDIFSYGEKADLIERTPLNRMGETREVADMIYFLTSEESSFMTGEIITLDGGFTL